MVMKIFRKEENKLKNKVLLISLAIVLAVSLGLVGCGGNGGPEVITLDFYTMYPPTYLYIAEFYPAVFGQIEDDSDEELQVEVHWSQELGGTVEADVIIGTGVADFGHVFAPHHPEECPLTGMASLPLAADDPRIVQDALMACLNASDNSTVAAMLSGEWEALGLVPIQLYPFVFPASYWGNGANVTCVEDLEGRNILQTGEYAANAVLEACNATVIVRTMHEAYESLYTGLVDSMFVVITTVPAFGLNEVLEWNVSNISLYLSTMTIMFCQDTWDSLSTEHQDIIWNAFWEHRYDMCEAGLAGWAEAEDVCEDWGIYFYEWPQEELDDFKALALPVWEDYIADWECEDFAEVFVGHLMDGGATPPWTP
jgi:TRAP-type C4-dicarboxylate transport system substrate-binding protein